MEKILRKIERAIPKKLYHFLQPYYHLLLAIIGTTIYLNPSRRLYVIAVTGTKGKSSTVEFINAVLEASGKKTALLSTIRFKVGEHSRPNKYKMTMPGRFFTQEFLHEASDAKCKYAIIEMTSEGARFFRHVGVELDALVFTNLSPEHIESHGSFAKYKKAKLRLANHLAKSKKLFRLSIANLDNEHAPAFLIGDVEKNIIYSFIANKKNTKEDLFEDEFLTEMKIRIAKFVKKGSSAIKSFGTIKTIFGKKCFFLKRL